MGGPIAPATVAILKVFHIRLHLRVGRKCSAEFSFCVETYVSKKTHQHEPLVFSFPSTACHPYIQTKLDTACLEFEIKVYRNYTKEWRRHEILAPYSPLRAQDTSSSFGEGRGIHVEYNHKGAAINVGHISHPNTRSQTLIVTFESASAPSERWSIL